MTIKATNPPPQAYCDELKSNLKQVIFLMDELSVKITLSRDVVYAVIADLLVTLEYASCTPTYDPTQARFLVEPTLQTVRGNLRGNNIRRRAWLHTFKSSVGHMERFGEWLRGEPPSGRLALIEEANHGLYETLDVLRHRNICLKYLEYEIPMLLTAAESILKIINREACVYSIPLLPRLDLSENYGVVLIANMDSTPASGGSEGTIRQCHSSNRHQSNQYDQSNAWPEKPNSQLNELNLPTEDCGGRPYEYRPV
ncbi:hypothetical protein TWF718_010465 [Orbilia javanica]|uniref:Uncharacterized protein n=1 Tax=Orbilia javanica TaxID=47235 RepID=A0AAN8RA32_9PEZI